MKKLLLLFLPAVIFFAGCSHTNELAKYNLNGKGVLFNKFVAPEASRIEIVTVEQNQQNKNEKKDSFLDAIASIGSEILSADNRAKLINSVNTDSLVNHVSAGIENALIAYLNVKPVTNFEGDPRFLVETTLNECKLLLQQSGVYVRVKATSTIIERGSGGIVWENSESETIPIKQYSQSYDQKNDSKAISKVMTGLQLASLSEEELNRVVGAAAESAGRYMAETLRDDVAEANKKK